MIITFLLLAVLTIGAVSAADADAASDNLNATEDADIINDYDIDEHYIDVNEEEIQLDENEIDYDDEEYIASITLPKNTKKGSFKIFNGEEVVASLKVDADDDDHWEKDGGILEGTIYLNDFDLTKVHDGDMLSFKFFETDGGHPVDIFTTVCKVNLTNSTLQLIVIYDGLTEDDVDIQVSNININKPNENFTYVDVAQKTGIFIITVGDNDVEIFKEDLNTTSRPYVKIRDDDDNQFYRFGFSFTDLNNYIAQNINGYTFNDLVNKRIISSGDDIYFDLCESDGETEIYTKQMTFTLTSDEILFNGEDVEVDYMDLEVIMYGAWQEKALLEYIISIDIESCEIVIYLDDNDTPAFKKSLTPDESDEDYDDEETYHYIVYIGDLNITKAGKYIIREYLNNDKGKPIYHYDYEDPEILELYDPQTITVDNVTVNVNPIPTSISSNETLITIDGAASEDDEILIYVDENKQPLTFKLSDCRKDENENYILKSKELNLKIGVHNLNVTYKGVNLSAKVELISNIFIELNETVYTTFNENFVYISADDEEEDGSGILAYDGEVNLTIMDKNGIIATLEKDIDELSYEENLDARVISTKDIDAELNGTYTVVVRYFNDNIGMTQTEGNVTFRSFDSKEYGTSIKNKVKNKNDSVITFTNITRDYAITVEIDGNTAAKIGKNDLSLDLEKQAYYIKYDKLGNLTEGYHSIKVSIDSKKTGKIELANGNILVDLEEDIDPSLTIAIANIEEGNAANAVITTNSAFSGDVIVQVADRNYTVKVVKGHGNTSITGLAVNKYIATAFLKYDGAFKDSVKTTTFEVTSKTVTDSKKSPVIKLTLKKVKIKKSAKKLVLRATLKINGKAKKGLKVIFKFKGKKYVKKTNKKGVAKVIIKKKVLKKLKVGKKVTYLAKYDNITKKRTVKVRK